MPSATATLPIENEGAASSLLRVPVPVPVPMVPPGPPRTVLMVALSVSFASNNASGVACTVKVWVRSIAPKVSVPELAR